MKATRAARSVLHVSFACALSLVTLSACGNTSTPVALSGQVRTPTPSVATVTLPDADGKPFTMKAEPGRLLIVYFGFTSCPDVCPTTLSDLKASLARIGTKADSVDLAMVTIDPAVDEASTLERYVRSFVPTATALRTDNDAVLRAAANAFGASYSIGQKADGSPEVSHSAWLYAVDERGDLRVQWPFGTKAKDLAADLTVLLKQVNTL